MAGKRTAADIEAEIERTRAELAQTVDALRDELSPSALVGKGAEQVKQTVSDATATLRGDGLPDDAGRARKVKMAFGAVAVAAGLIVAKSFGRKK